MVSKIKGLIVHKVDVQVSTFIIIGFFLFVLHIVVGKLDWVLKWIVG
jgi:hypothetical protein